MLSILVWTLCHAALSIAMMMRQRAYCLDTSLRKIRMHAHRHKVKQGKNFLCFANRKRCRDKYIAGWFDCLPPLLHPQASNRRLSPLSFQIAPHPEKIILQPAYLFAFWTPLIWTPVIQEVFFTGFLRRLSPAQMNLCSYFLSPLMPLH